MAVKRMINRVSVDAAFFKKLSPHENLIYGANGWLLPRAPGARVAVSLFTWTCSSLQTGC